MKTQFVFQSELNLWLYAAAGFSAMAGIIHITVTSEHFEEWIGYGVFFTVASAYQLLLALILTITQRPVRREILWVGILGNLAIIAMWMVTRTIGVPLGPMTGEIEEIGALDMASKIAELAVIVCLAVALRMQSDNGRHIGSPNA